MTNIHFFGWYSILTVDNNIVKLVTQYHGNTFVVFPFKLSRADEVLKIIFITEIKSSLPFSPLNIDWATDCENLSKIIADTYANFKIEL